MSGELTWANQPDATVPVAENISHNEQTKYVFSCVDAVRYWYEGDPTGMNENYGIMVRYYDETLINYNSIYSADCAYAAKRPVIAITYEGPSVNILEGFTRTLSVTGATGVVTWSSSNTAVATVDSTGVVTGIKAGHTVVTASVDGEAYQTFTVYVKIQDGVYYVENLSTGLYLGTYGGVADNTITTLFYKATSDRAQLNQLWRITYLDNGYYSIHPIYMPSMGLHATSNVVDIKTIQTDDSASGVLLVNRWGIEHGADGYKFTHVGTSSLTMKATASYSDYVISTEVYSASETGFLWDLERVTDLPNQVLLIDTQTGASLNGVTRYIEPGKTVTMADLGFAASFVSMYQTDQTITWSAQYPSVAAVDPETGAITPLKAGGTTEIYAKHNYNGYDHVAHFTVYIKPVPNGDYYIRSRAYNRFVQIEKIDAINGFSTSGAAMEQWDYDEGNYQKWSFIWRGNGYYSIISAQSGMALSVASNQTGSTEVSLVQETYTGADRQLWKITATNGASYKIKAKSAEGLSNDLVMTAGHETNNDSNGLAIEQCQYTDDDNYIDEWFVCSIVDVGMSTDDYSGSTEEPSRKRNSYLYANSFYTGLTGSLGIAPFTLTHNYNKDFKHMASKADFAENGAMSNDIDFMVYIGHGHDAEVADDGQVLWGNHIQYSYSIDGYIEYTDVCESELYTQTQKDEFCLYTSEARFGSIESDLRWVWMYTCNFLNSIESYEEYKDILPIDGNGYVEDADLAEMMTGAHIVMGYATQSYLCNSNATIFSNYLRSGMPIIEAFFKAGCEGEGAGKEHGGTDDHHVQKVMYIPQARYETIYSPAVNYEYESIDVLYISHDIQEPY